MADISDVEDVLAQLATTAIYPSGTGVPSVPGPTVKLATGWPLPQQLDQILAAGHVMVTVFAKSMTEQNTTRFPPQMQVLTGIPAPELTLTVASNRITVGGSIKAGEAATALVNYFGYSYGVKENDTFAIIAASLAALIPNATAAGAVITLNQVFDISVRVSVPVVMQEEIARQKREIFITTWAPSPDARKQVAQVIDGFLKSPEQARILMPDNTLARLIYRGTMETDHLAKQRIYRRDLRYEVEYVTSKTEIDNTVTDFGVNVTPTGGITTTFNI